MILPISKIVALTFFSILISSPAQAAKAEKIPDLVAVKDGTPVQMFEAGIAALGGMAQFVKKGQTVLVKPNIGWDRTPEQGANTHPELVGAIVKKAYEAGAARVVVFDHTCDEMKACYRNSGIKKAVEENKGVMLSGGDERDYVDVEIPGATILKKAKVHKAFMEADVIINVPVLKNHMGGRMTASLKNLMGVVWDRRFWHSEGLQQCIGEFPLLKKKVDLTIIDAYRVMVADGPRGISPENIKLMKMQLLSRDMVLVDTAAAKILEMNPKDIPYLITANALKIGTMDLDKANIKRISVPSP